MRKQQGGGHCLPPWWVTGFCWALCTPTAWSTWAPVWFTLDSDVMLVEPMSLRTRKPELLGSRNHQLSFSSLDWRWEWKTIPVIWAFSTLLTLSVLALFNMVYGGFPGGSDGKASAYGVRDPGSIPESGRPPEGNGYLLQYSWLENSMDRGAWQATVHGVAKSWTWLSN